MLQDEQDWEDRTKDHPFSWETRELHPNPATRPSGQRLPSLGFAFSLHSYLAAEVRSGVRRDLAAGARCHRSQGTEGRASWLSELHKSIPSNWGFGLNHFPTQERGEEQGESRRETRPMPNASAPLR